MWSFATVRALAIRELAPLASVIEKIVLARAHAVEEWLRPAFVELCLRSAKLGRNEAARLKAHPDDVVLVFTVRDELRDGRLPREEVVVTERVDAWLTGKTFIFPQAKVEIRAITTEPTFSVPPPPPQKPIKTSSSSSSGELSLPV